MTEAAKPQPKTPRKSQPKQDPKPTQTGTRRKLGNGLVVINH